jgi:hypothetical protein
MERLVEKNPGVAEPRERIGSRLAPVQRQKVKQLCGSNLLQVTPVLNLLARNDGAESQGQSFRPLVHWHLDEVAA